MKINERLLYLAEKLEKSRSIFSDKIGVNNSTFHGYLVEDGAQRVKLSLLLNILEKYPTVNRNWLVFGEGKPFQKSEENQESSPTHTIATPVADAVRTAETALRQAGATDAVVWQTVMGLAKVNADKEE
ncbi:hypothetical protein [Pseudodesulfovibrio tunisiensis]|uniref:hypothetical protein n=1 Tax=Pseudodesulfovibrio tunisiensis TaxID=463192 RepID=UPI001FB4F542|nr:hypothetical protein [Pseudodesulfovibrio tunisiensis]